MLDPRVVTTSTTLDRGYNAVLADATGGPITLTLPSTASAVDQGTVLIIKKVDATANVVTVQRQGTDTIDGATTYVLGSQWKFVTLLGDGQRRWLVIGAN